MLPFDQIAHVRINPSRNLKLITREIVFEAFQPVSKFKKKTYLNVTDERTA